MDDWRRLKQYAQGGSEAAFAEIIRQHTDLVYSVCQREIGDTMLAEEAAQAVFLVLAQKAGTLRQEAALASWLFATARLTSRSILRRESRRQRREEKAVVEAVIEMEQATPPETSRWEEAEPLLNDALSTLSAAQRSLVILRFWEDCPLADIGHSLGISEDAARMRLNRALDRLRRWLSARNVALSAAALAAGLPLAVRPAPARCAEVLTRLPLPPAVPPDPAFLPSLTAQGVLCTMNTHRLKLQWGAAALIACLSLGTAGAVQVSHQRHVQTIVAAQKAQQKQDQAAALAVLDRMYATYAAMKSFKCDTLSQETDNGGAVASYEIERINGTSLQRDKIRFARATLINDPELSGKALAVCNGNTFYVTCTENKGLADRYAKFPAYRGSPSDFGGLGSWGGTAITGMPNIFFGNKLGRISNLSEPEYSMGKPTTIDFSGIAYPVALNVVIAKMAYRDGTPGRNWPGAAMMVTFYIGQQDNLLYQVVVSDSTSPTRLEISTQKIYGMEINKPINPDDFVFTPPLGSHEVITTQDLFPGR